MKVLLMLVLTAISACVFTGCKKDAADPAPKGIVKGSLSSGGEEPPVPPPPRKP